MCGRINVSDHQGVQQLLDYLDIPLRPDKFISSYNIAPGAPLFSAFANEQAFQACEGAYMSWGILPDWAKPDKFSRPLINARAETLWEKPSFRNLIKSQRVIIPVNGFYEWKRETNRKLAYHIQSNKHAAIALAGLYQVSKQGNAQCCIITTEANTAMASVHHRMPVILDPTTYADWLRSEDRNLITSLMAPCPSDKISLQPVSSYVNNAKHDGPQCLAITEEFKLI